MKARSARRCECDQGVRHNFVVLIGFTLSAIGAYFFIRHLTGNRYAAATAAVLFAYCPYVFARTAHIQLLMIWGLPFCLLAFHRLIDRPTVGRGVELGLVLWIQGLTCAYYGIFAGMLVGFGTLFFAQTRRQWTSREYWIAIGIAFVVCVGLTAPFFYLSRCSADRVRPDDRGCDEIFRQLAIVVRVGIVGASPVAAAAAERARAKPVQWRGVSGDHHVDVRIGRNLDRFDQITREP